MGLMYRFCCTRKREALLSSFAPAYSTSSSTSRASMAHGWVTRIEHKGDDIGIVDHFVPVQLAGVVSRNRTRHPYLDIPRHGMADLRFYYIIMSSFAQHGTVKKYSLHRASDHHNYNRCPRDVHHLYVVGNHTRHLSSSRLRCGIAHSSYRMWILQSLFSR